MGIKETQNKHSLINNIDKEIKFWSTKIHFAHQLEEKMNYKEFFTKQFLKNYHST